MTTAGYQPGLQEAYGTLHYGKTAYAELRVVCLWSLVGLTLTGLLFAMGLGDGMGEALMLAG